MDEIDLRRLRFSDPTLEAEFEAQYGRRAIRHVRLMLVLVLCVYGIFAATQGDVDSSLLPVVILRYSIMLPAFSICLALTWHRRFKRWMQPVMSGAMLLLGLDVVLSMVIRSGLFPGLVLPAGVASPAAPTFAPADLMVIILSTFTLARLRFVYATVVAWTVIGLYLAVTILARNHGSLVDQLPRYYYEIFFTNLLGMSAGLSLERYVRRDFAQSRLLQQAHDRAERLLLNILPGSIAERLKRDTAVIADQFSDVTVLFADIEGFTSLSQDLGAVSLVRLLNDLFTCFDGLAEKHGLEKIKTIGDAYMAASGLPEPRPDHAEAAAAMALDMQQSVADYSGTTGIPLRIRVGLNSGAVVAGVIGTKKFIYDLWGDAVNTASRMESQGPSGRIQVTEATNALLQHRFRLEARGPIAIKGKGIVPVYLLIEERAGNPTELNT